jgi:hypothetical protein
VIRELATSTDAQTWVIASMLFFVVVFTVIAVRVLTRPRSHYDRQAHLPLDDSEGGDEVSHG